MNLGPACLPFPCRRCQQVWWCTSKLVSALVGGRLLVFPGSEDALTSTAS